MPTAEHIQQVFERYTAALTARDYDTALSLFAPDATALDPVDGPPLDDLDALRAVITGSADVIHAVRLSGPVRVSADCHHAAAPIEAELDFGNGPQIMSVIDVMTFDDDGRVTSLTAYYGPANLRDA